MNWPEAIRRCFERDQAFYSGHAGRAQSNRPIHAVCAYDATQDCAVVITVYQPDPNRWEDYRRRKA